MSVKAAVCLWVVLILTGCGSTGGVPDSPDTMTVKPVYQDVPTPRNWNYEDGRITENERFRTGEMYGTVDASVDNLVDFYRRQMAANGWKLLATEGLNPITMKFTKDLERCHVVIESNQGPTRLRITLGLK
jgi:hypothetical protein